MKTRLITDSGARGLDHDPRLRAGRRPPVSCHVAVPVPRRLTACVCVPAPRSHWDTRPYPSIKELPGRRPGGLGHRLTDGVVSNACSAGLLPLLPRSVVSCPRPSTCSTAEGQPVAWWVYTHLDPVVWPGVQASGPGQTTREQTGQQIWWLWASRCTLGSRTEVLCRGSVLGTRSNPFCSFCFLGLQGPRRRTGQARYSLAVFRE